MSGKTEYYLWGSDGYTTTTIEAPQEITKHYDVISLYSGGLGSFAATALLVEQGKSVLTYFNDTKIEHPDLYRFLVESVNQLGVDLVVDADGRNPFDVFKSVRYMGNTRRDPCSEQLKRARSREFCASFPDSLVSVGIDWTEQHRFDKAQQYWGGRLIAPLCDETINRDEIIAKYGMKIPELYAMGFPHNNCGGFCVKAGLQQFATLLTHRPDYYLWCEEQEQKCYDHIGKRHPFLRKTVKGITYYITMREFREWKETNKLYCNGKLIYDGEFNAKEYQPTRSCACGF